MPDLSGPIACLLPLLISSILLADEPDRKPKQIQVDVTIREEWLPLPPPGDGGSTQSAIKILRALDPKTGKPYDDSPRPFACDPTKLRREFRLEKTEFLLNEPILVEFRVELDGPGIWREPCGGNYRGRGRDDNYLFLMRHEVGTWLTDPYVQRLGMGGGIGSALEVKRGQSLSQWLAVSRWGAIDRPGTYDLYCFHQTPRWEAAGIRPAIFDALPAEVRADHAFDASGNLIDSRTGRPTERYALSQRWLKGDQPPSPLLHEVPAEVAAKVGDWPIAEVADFAHVRFKVVPGTDPERRRMIARWTEIADAPEPQSRSSARWSAARQAIAFAQGVDFLPLVAKWLADPPKYDKALYDGLARNPDPRATAIILKGRTPAAAASLAQLRPERVADAIPTLIDWLTDDDSEVRAQAESLLRAWTGQTFGHTWEGFDYHRPTLDEGKAMQPHWRDWWEKNRDGFKPRPPRG